MDAFSIRKGGQQGWSRLEETHDSRIYDCGGYRGQRNSPAYQPHLGRQYQNDGSQGRTRGTDAREKATDLDD